jgi:hypothetical protein
MTHHRCGRGRKDPNVSLLERADDPSWCRTTKSQITPTELQQLRQLVVLTIGGLS